MNFKAIISILFVFIIYFGMHFFLYRLVIKIFDITKQKIKKILSGIFFILSIGFILAMIFTRLSDFFLIKYFYIATSLWLGIITIMLFSFAFSFVLIVFFKFHNVKIIIGIFALVLSLLYGVYGVWNAFDLNIKNIEVNIVNLPDYWKDKKIVQLSDVHLGRINGVSFAKKIVEKVNNIKPDLILITGDLFDGTGSDVAKFIKTLDKLESTHGVYFIIGNHEAYLGFDYVISNLKDSKINILDNRAVNINSLQITGISYPGFSELNGDNFSENISNFILGMPNILMYHSPTNIIQNKNQHSDVYLSPDIDFSIAKKNNINLQLSGHTHKGQIFPFDLLADYIYKKYNYGLVTEGDFNIYITSGVGTWGPPMRTGSNAEIVVINLK